LKEASQLKALSFKRLGKWEDAVESFSGMYKIDPEIYSSVELAKLYEHKLKDPVKALEVVERIEALIEISSYMGHELPDVISQMQHRKKRLRRKIDRMLHN
jgi:hypothetical protein